MSLARWLRGTIGGALLIAACSSDGTGTTDPGTISLSLATGASSVVQGGTTTVGAALSRGGGFTGDVTFTVTGAPTGVTATVGNVQTSGTVTTATVTISVAAAVVTGAYPLTVRASGTGVAEATAPYTLTVLAGS